MARLSIFSFGRTCFSPAAPSPAPINRLNEMSAKHQNPDIRISQTDAAVNRRMCQHSCVVYRRIYGTEWLRNEVSINISLGSSSAFEAVSRHACVKK
jgi:hypothetical protein